MVMGRMALHGRAHVHLHMIGLMVMENGGRTMAGLAMMHPQAMAGRSKALGGRILVGRVDSLTF